jgi:ferrous iron transport protein A
MQPLSAFQRGEHARICQISGPPGVVQRLYEFGLLEGQIVEILGFAPLGDPMEIRVGQTRLSIRKAEAAGILAELCSNPQALTSS